MLPVFARSRPIGTRYATPGCEGYGPNTDQAMNCNAFQIFFALPLPIQEENSRARTNYHFISDIGSREHYGSRSCAPRDCASRYGARTTCRMRMKRISRQTVSRAQKDLAMTDTPSRPAFLRRYGLPAALMLLCLLLCLGRPAAARTLNGYGMPTGAFLQQPAPTVAALTWQLSKDRVVSIRYARLFNMSPQMVHQAFGRLRLVRLPEDRVLQVFYVRPGERIGYLLRRVRKGTLVYELPDGTPLLLRRCGNPIHKVLPTQRSMPLSSVPEYAPYESLPAMTFSSANAPLLRSATPSDFVEAAVTVPNKLPATPATIPPGKLPVVAGTHLGNWAWGFVPIVIGGIGG